MQSGQGLQLEAGFFYTQAPSQPADPSMPEDGIKSLAEAAEASYSSVFIRTSLIIFLILSRESL